MPIEWNEAPPPERSWAHCRLLRTPMGKELRGIITSQKLIGCRTHFTKGRTTPCLGSACLPCEAGHSWAWHGYISLYEPSHASICIFECTEQAAQQIIRQAAGFGTLRGLHLSARRTANRPNARVLIKLEPHSFPADALPPGVDLMKYLEHMWGEDTTNEPPILDERTLPLHASGGNGRFSLPG